MLSFSLRALSLRRARHLGPAEIEAIQRERLAALLRRVVRDSPFYREKYRGVDPDRASLADLPPTSKAEMTADFDRVPTDREVTRDALERFLDEPSNAERKFLGRYVASHTSGSQGQPMLLVQTKENVELLFALQVSRGNPH